MYFQMNVIPTGKNKRDNQTNKRWVNKRFITSRNNTVICCCRSKMPDIVQVSIIIPEPATYSKISVGSVQGQAPLVSTVRSRFYG